MKSKLGYLLDDGVHLKGYSGPQRNPIFASNHYKLFSAAVVRYQFGRVVSALANETNSQGFESTRARLTFAFFVFQ